MNLLQNAAVHTLYGGPVDLRFAEESSAWRFEVADQGGGLPRGEEEAFFQPFRRGKGSAPGSGLGLAIVRGIAEAHGGSAGVDNDPGRGVTFWIRVPR
jgi:signal transduction histidine kinase